MPRHTFHLEFNYDILHPSHVVVSDATGETLACVLGFTKNEEEWPAHIQQCKYCVQDVVRSNVQLDTQPMWLKLDTTPWDVYE